MFLKELEIQNFRNYDKINLKLTKNINIFFGLNGAGKTNLLESIYFLSFTKSHRVFIDKALIKKNEEFLKIKGTLKTKETLSTKLEILMNNESKKIFIDNNLTSKVGEYIAKMNIIIFYPEDLEIIKGSPSIRRKYINTSICQYDEKYINLLNDYKKVLKMRNNYIKGNIDESYMIVINDYFAKVALKIFQIRKKFFTEINNYIGNIFFDLLSIQGLNINYDSFLKEEIEYEEDIIKLIIKKLENNLTSDIKYGSTQIGPHKDDFIFEVNKENLKHFGSQGQQRLSILALKLSELEIIKAKKGETPILLLDDVFSELDNLKKNKLLKYINKDLQVIITTTDLDNIEEKLKKKAKIFEIENGNLKTEVN
jgi:DNA replication and repair protein RecF